MFSLADAQCLLPVILRLTEAANIRVRALLQNLEIVADRESVKAKEIEAEVDRTVRQWQLKIEKLGAVAKGLWLIDFDNGEGYFCWKFPERKIMYQHGYHDGFSGRKNICEGEELYNNEH